MAISQKLIKLFSFFIVYYIIYYTVNKENKLFLWFIEVPNDTVWGIIHLNSLIFMVGVLLSVSIGYFNINSIYFIIKIFLFTNIPVIRKRSVFLKNNMKKIIDKYYESGIDSISEKELKHFPRTFKIIINQLQMRIPIDDIFEIIKRQKGKYLSKVEDAVSILAVLSSVAPSTGVMGTVIGLIKLLENLKDPSTIGANMSVALMTTLYGLVFSNLVFSPLRRLLIEFESFSIDIYADSEFFLKIIKENNPAFYSDQNYDKLPKKK